MHGCDSPARAVCGSIEDGHLEKNYSSQHREETKQAVGVEQMKVLDEFCWKEELFQLKNP